MGAPGTESHPDRAAWSTLRLDATRPNNAKRSKPKSPWRSRPHRGHRANCGPLARGGQPGWGKRRTKQTRGSPGAGARGARVRGLKGTHVSWVLPPGPHCDYGREGPSRSQHSALHRACLGGPRRPGGYQSLLRLRKGSGQFQPLTALTHLRERKRQEALRKFTVHGAQSTATSSARH